MNTLFKVQTERRVLGDDNSDGDSDDDGGDDDSGDGGDDDGDGGDSEGAHTWT